MAAKQQQMSGDGFTSHIAGMSKSQLYDIMSQMKVLIEQNQQQARQILIENPLLTRALFQAQIMLGMVQPSQAMPNIQQGLSQPQPAQVAQQPNVQITQPLPVQAGIQGQAISSQLPIPARQQHPTQPSISLPSASLPPLTFHSQPIPPNPPQLAQQTSGFLNAQGPAAPPQSSQLHNVHPLPSAPPWHSIHQSHIPMVSGQTQHTLQTPGQLHQPLQLPMPQQPRPPPMQPFSHQLQQMPHGLGFHPSSAPQPLFPQSLFHSGVNPTSSFAQGQPTLPNQQPLQQLYQGFPHLGSEYGNQAGSSSMQPERGAPWGPGMQEKATGGAQFTVPPSFISGQMAQGTGGQPPRPPPLTPEMEKVLLQQVMGLTPEQINLLPPEQRQQVIQLQDMLR